MPEPKHIWNTAQTQVLQSRQSTIVVGPAGSGKTTVLLEKARMLHAQGQKVQWLTFAFRMTEYMKANNIAELPFPASTMVDAVLAHLQAHGVKINIATNNHMRQLVRQLMATQAFQGSLAEAEHIIRGAKSRAKKLPENDRHYTFVKAYQNLLESQGLLDRHDIIRRHILTMKEGSIPPLPANWLMIDHLPDITELQLIWLQQHLAQGAQVLAAADDDTTAFGRDGAMAAGAITALQDLEIAVINLPTSWSLPSTLAPALSRIARQLRQRVAKAEGTSSTIVGHLQVQAFATRRAEHAFILERCQTWASQQQTVGLITRTDADANHLAHTLRKRGLNPASYARLVWEKPTPQLVLAVLYIMLGQHTPAHIQLVLLGLGVPMSAIPPAPELGTWLAQGAKLVYTPDLSPTVTTTMGRVRQIFRGAYTLWHGQHLPPREVFKSLMAEIIHLLPESEQESALLATDMLLSLGGNINEILPRIMQETLPDMRSPIIVAPVREVRNHQFQHVIMPYAGASAWPLSEGSLLPPEPDYERRLWLLATSRTRESLLITYHEPTPSPLAQELQHAVAQAARRG
jgi:hypothetical protein